MPVNYPLILSINNIYHPVDIDGIVSESKNSPNLTIQSSLKIILMDKINGPLGFAACQSKN